MNDTLVLSILAYMRQNFWKTPSVIVLPTQRKSKCLDCSRKFIVSYFGANNITLYQHKCCYLIT